MRSSKLPSFLCVVGAILVGCANPSDGSSGSADEQDLTSDTSSAPVSPDPGIDCRAACPSDGLSFYSSAVSSKGQWGDVEVEQYGDCSLDHPSTDPGRKYHLTAAGEPCFLVAPDDAAPVGAYSCESFVCGESGAFTASACVDAASDPAPHFLRKRHCATREEACALAYQANGDRLDAEPSSRAHLCK